MTESEASSGTGPRWPPTSAHPWQLRDTTAAAVALLSACAGSDTPGTPEDDPTNHAQTGGFTVTMTTDRDRYSDSQDVRYTVEVCNGGPAITTKGGGGRDVPFSFRVEDDHDRLVADDSNTLHTLELRTVRWTRGQCRTAAGTWDQHYWNRPQDQSSEPDAAAGLPQRGELVPAGHYRIRITSAHGSATASVQVERKPDAT